MSTCDLKWNQNEYMKTLGKIAQDYAFVCWLKSRQAQCGALNVFLILTIELLNNLSSIMTALWKLLAYWWLWQCNCSSLFGVYFENRHSWYTSFSLHHLVPKSIFGGSKYNTELSELNVNVCIFMSTNWSELIVKSRSFI